MVLYLGWVQIKENSVPSPVFSVPLLFKMNRSGLAFFLRFFLRRDLLVTRNLRRAGWRVLRIWEHDLTKRSEACVKKIQAALDK